MEEVVVELLQVRFSYVGGQGRVCVCQGDLFFMGGSDFLDEFFDGIKILVKKKKFFGQEFYMWIYGRNFWERDYFQNQVDQNIR